MQVGRTIKPALALIILLLLLHPAGARAGEGMPVVPAQEILDKIERGEPVEYDHVIVEGDLDLGKLELPKRHVNRTWDEIEYYGLSENASFVSSSIRISDSNINGNISFGNAIFSNLVDFSGSAFNGDADFRGSAFNGNASFEGSAFNGDADFWDSAFNGNAYFRDSAFNGMPTSGARLSTALPTSGARLSTATAYFGDSAFNGDCRLQGLGFQRHCLLRGSAFNGTAYFMGSAFNGAAYFGDSAFNGTADFGDSDFNGDANFGGSDFNNSDFSSAQFNSPVSFDDANFSNSTSFNSSRFKEDALFEGAVFDGPLYLTRTKYDRLYIRWKNIQELGYDDAAYLTLLENFKKLGYAEDYDACYYEYRQAASRPELERQISCHAPLGGVAAKEDRSGAGCLLRLRQEADSAPALVCGNHPTLRPPLAQGGGGWTPGQGSGHLREVRPPREREQENILGRGASRPPGSHALQRHPLPLRHPPLRRSAGNAGAAGLVCRSCPWLLHRRESSWCLLLHPLLPGHQRDGGEVRENAANPLGRWRSCHSINSTIFQM